MIVYVNIYSQQVETNKIVYVDIYLQHVETIQNHTYFINVHYLLYCLAH